MKKTRVAQNLYLYEREETGAAYYVFRGTINGKRVEKSLGSAKAIGIKEAKLRAAQFMVEGPKEKTSQTFADIFDKALADIARIKQWKTQKQYHDWYRSVEIHAYKALAGKRIDDISRDDIYNVLAPLWTTTNTTAVAVRLRLEAIFNWAIVHGIRTAPNPATWAGNLALLLPAPAKVAPVTHREAPTLEELRRVVRECLDKPSTVSGVLLLTIATASRVSEVLEADADEFEGAVWTVPVEHQKVASGVRRVPLSTLALQAVEMGAETGRVFSSSVGTVMRASTALRNLVRIVGRPVTVHGIRSAFRDWAAENEIQDAVAEKCLSHTWGNAVTVAYYRSDLFDKRKDALDRWAKALTEV